MAELGEGTPNIFVTTVDMLRLITRRCLCNTWLEVAATAVLRLLTWSESQGLPLLLTGENPSFLLEIELCLDDLLAHWVLINVIILW